MHNVNIVCARIDNLKQFLIASLKVITILLVEIYLMVKEKVENKGLI